MAGVRQACAYSGRMPASANDLRARLAGLTEQLATVRGRL